MEEKKPTAPEETQAKEPTPEKAPQPAMPENIKRVFEYRPLSEYRPPPESWEGRMTDHRTRYREVIKQRTAQGKLPKRCSDCPYMGVRELGIASSAVMCNHPLTEKFSNRAPLIVDPTDGIELDNFCAPLKVEYHFCDDPGLSRWRRFVLALHRVFWRWKIWRYKPLNK